MTVINFTIYGNQEKKNGNPIPYFRVTSQSRFSKGTKRYHEWEDYVRAAFIDGLKGKTMEYMTEVSGFVSFTNKKPIKAFDGKIHMRLIIVWANKAHADSDNVFKGIADALFMNDKYLVGEFDYTYGDVGRVEVTITF